MSTQCFITEQKKNKNNQLIKNFEFELKIIYGILIASDAGSENDFNKLFTIFLVNN